MSTNSSSSNVIITGESIATLTAKIGPAGEVVTLTAEDRAAITALNLDARRYLTNKAQRIAELRANGFRIGAGPVTARR